MVTAAIGASDLPRARSLVEAPLATRAPLEVLHRVGDVDRLRRDRGLLQGTPQQGARRPDERLPLTVLAVSGLLTDEHQPGARPDPRRRRFGSRPSRDCTHGSPAPLCSGLGESVCRAGSLRRWRSSSETRAQHLLALLGSLAARLLCSPEEFRELGVSLALGVLDVGLEPQNVAQTLLREPDHVVVLVLGAGDLSGLL